MIDYLPIDMLIGESFAMLGIELVEVLFFIFINNKKERETNTGVRI